MVPGRLATLTGGYIYDRRIAEGLRALGWRVTVRELDDSFPRPTDRARADAAKLLASIPDGATVLIDGLALGAMPVQAMQECARLRLIGLVHHPLAAETGWDRETAAALERSEQQALAAVRRVVVTSRATAESVARYDVEPSRIAVVEPGTDPAPLARGSRNGRHLLCVASFIPRKGYDVLFNALPAIDQCEWWLTCVGSLSRDERTTSDVLRLLNDRGIRDRVALVGEAVGEQLAMQYDAADFFVSPTRHEGYGMAVAEALARGLPVVSTPTGAIGELVGDDAGILVPSDDVGALRAALIRVLSDGGLRERLAAGARRVRARLRSWDRAAAEMAAVLAPA